MAEAKYHHSNYKYEGWLNKWTNYLNRYQKRWVVLRHGLLSYYRNQVDMDRTCRGTYNLAKAVIQMEDSITITISIVSTKTLYFKATTEDEALKWITALELMKTKAKNFVDEEPERAFSTLKRYKSLSRDAISQDRLNALAVLSVDKVIVMKNAQFNRKVMDKFAQQKNRRAQFMLKEAWSDEEEVQQPDKAELNLMLHNLKAKLEDLGTCNDLIARHGLALTKTLSELETTTSPNDPTSHMKAVQERATLFRITATAMINMCREFYELSQNYGRHWHGVERHHVEPQQLGPSQGTLPINHLSQAEQINQTTAHPTEESAAQRDKDMSDHPHKDTGQLLDRLDIEALIKLIDMKKQLDGLGMVKQDEQMELLAALDHLSSPNMANNKKLLEAVPALYLLHSLGSRQLMTFN